MPTWKEVFGIAGTSIHDSEAELDDDCVSENSYFGDDDADKLDPLPPAYPKKEYPQSRSILANMDQQSPHVVPKRITMRSSQPALNTKFSGQSMCVVCKVSPAYRKGPVSYPTCGLTCASKRSVSQMCEVCHVLPRARKAGQTFRTCGFTCDAALAKGLSVSDHEYGTRNSPQQDCRRGPRQVRQPNCVVCWVQPCYDDGYVTCGIKCAETLCKRGNSNPKICDYCHRRPKIPGHKQCGRTCRDKARTACLLCRCQPKTGRYSLCGEICKIIATKWALLILEARPGHITHNEVQERFKGAWKGGDECPSIKKIYKIIEDESLLLPYERYKKKFGNEVFCYQGTSRRCTLGSHRNTRLCFSGDCALCSILRTSTLLIQTEHLVLASILHLQRTKLIITRRKVQAL